MTEVLSPITGSVWKIVAGGGTVVSEGETIVILESMKMEIRVKAPHSGTVVEIRAQEGDSILEDEVLVVIQ